MIDKIERMKPGLILLLLCTFFIACKPDQSDTQGVSDLIIKVNNSVGNQAVQYGQMIYMNNAGNKYKVNLLKYYLSNFVFTQEDGSQFRASNYELIDAFDSTTCYLQFKNVPQGKYTSLQFSVGIDSMRNHTGLQEDDLDPLHGMIWTWNTGYIFFKHEGQFLDANLSPQQLLYHFGTDKAYTQIQLALPSVDIRDASKTLHIDFDLNALYNTPNEINFIDNNIHESLSADDSKWMKEMQDNFKQSFSFIKVE